MFTESMVETNLGHASGRRWATLASLTFQTALVAAFLVLPMLRNDVLNLRTPKSLTVPIFTSARPTSHERTNTSTTTTGATQSPHEFVQPSEIPVTIADPGPDSRVSEAVCVTCPSGPSVHENQSAFEMIGSGPAPVVRKPDPPQRVRLSEIELGQLVHRVVPSYPEIARRAGIQGEVVLTALIGRDGGIESLAVSSGHPMLVGAARDAVRQWRYRPFRLNGEPVEVETQITVRFAMNR